MDTRLSFQLVAAIMVASAFIIGLRVGEELLRPPESCTAIYFGPELLSQQLLRGR